MKRAIIVIVLMFFSVSAESQYFSEKVLQKSFEKSKYFFTPNYLNNFALDGFEKVTVGLIQERFTNLIYNPAYVTNSFSNFEIFFDFHSVIENKDKYQYDYPIIMYEYIRIAPPYPIYFSKPRIEPDPILSFALFTKPFPSNFKKFHFGLTYQLIYLNEGYYPVPQDIYYPIFGYDYRGVVFGGIEDYPVVDRYTGTNYMKNQGHLISSYLGYEFTDDFKFGIKINRTIYDRDGAGGNSNLWDNYYSNYTSVWYKLEERTQNYSHWDFAAGADYKISEESNLGFAVGYLPGKVTQNLDRLDSSYSSSGTVNVGSFWHYSRRYAPTIQNWENKGNIFFAGLNFKTNIQENQTIFLRYYYENGNKDITNSSGIFDTSYYSSSAQWDTYVYRYESFSKVIDDRKGCGTDKSNLHELQALMLWDLDDKFSINFGIYYSYENLITRTSESVFADRISSTISTGSYPYNYYNRVIEEKELKWEFDWDKKTLQIPVFFKWKVSEYFILLTGLNRIISDIEAKDVTTAYFHYREEIKNTTPTRKEKFAERYRMPKESISEVRTASFFGVNFTPSNKVLLRLLVQPNFGDDERDSQVWLSFLLMP